MQASVSGLLLQVCMFGKALVSGLLLEECIFVKASVSGLLLEGQFLWAAWRGIVEKGRVAVLPLPPQTSLLSTCQTSRCYPRRRLIFSKERTINPPFAQRSLTVCKADCTDIQHHVYEPRMYVRT